MKKRILGLMLVLCFVVPAFVGCSLYTENTDKINSAVAIRIGDEVITREELKNAYTTYYNYGYGYMYDQDELMDFVVRSLVSQKVALIVAKKTINITAEDFDKIIESVEESLKSALDERERAIYEKAGEEIPERICTGKDCTIESHNHEEDDKSEPYKPYESVIVKPITDMGVAISSSEKSTKINEFIAKLKEESQKYPTRLNAFNEYMAELVQVDLIDGKNTEKETALKNQIDTMVSYYENQKYVEKLQEYVESKIEITDDEVLAKFNQLINIEKQTYAGNTFADAYEKSDSTGMFLYYGYSDKDEDGEPAENGYIHVQHLLIQFSDEVKAELAKLPGYGISEKEYRYHLGQQWLKTHADKEGAPAYYWFPETDEEKNETANFLSLEEWEAYIKIRDTYLNGLTTTYLDPETGKKVVDEDGKEKTVTLAEVKAEIAALAADSTKTEVEKAQEFRKLIFIYGADPGMFQVGKTTEVLGYSLPADMEKFSSDIGNNAGGFVGEFVVGAYNLAENGISSDAVLTDHGAHFIINLGKTTSGAVWEYDTDKSKAENIEDMKATLLSPSYGLSVYEYVYSKILTEKKSTAYNDFILAQKAELKNIIEYNFTSYKKVFAD